jgi:hypothetical protein
MPDQAVLDQVADDKGHDEGSENRKNKVVADNIVADCEFGKKHCGVSAQGHELAMRHVDNAHLTEDHGEAKRHKQQNTEQADPGERLHNKDVAHFCH